MSYPTRDLLRVIRAEAERTLTPREVEAYLSAPVTDVERGDALAQVRWFRQRYPTGADRLAYVRRAYRRWTRSSGVGGRPGRCWTMVVDHGMVGAHG